MASPSFFKGHGHGNDYLVFEEGQGWPVAPDQIRDVCDRHRGVGSDGIVVILRGRSDDGLTLRMFNPDGSEFERSGNGLRVVASYLYLAGRVGGEPFPVRVGGQNVTMQVLGPARVDHGGAAEDGALDVAVEMGIVRFGAEAVDMSPAGEPESDARAETADLEHPRTGPLTLHPVSVGNPHAVCFRDPLDARELPVLGPWIATHGRFRSGTNVQLAQVTAPGRMDILIWERGVGRTLSSGTSACAAAAAAVRSGRTPPGRVRVGMEGGEFEVTVGKDFQVRLQGPVTPVLYGTLASGLLGALL